ncbi:MAG: zinc ribbon domain-containing protein [Vicinamibacterales bacterium]
MPLYEYQCDACGQRFEIIQKYADGPPDACRKCGKGPVHRLQSSPAIQFKGSGWYVTDYAQKSGTDSSKGPSASASEPQSDGSTKGESKGESKNETKSETPAKSDAPAASSPTPSASKE